MSPKKIALLTDSCADLAPALAAENHIYTVPLRILCADGEYADGVDITAKEIYSRLRAGELPQTSLPKIEDIAKALEQIAADGYDGAIATMPSGGLSGTYNMTRLVAGEWKGLAVRVYDSVSGSLGMGLTLLQLAEDIRNGMDWETLTERRVPRLIASTFPFFSVDTLEYLQKGGRIGKITATAGTLLQIKPIITFAADGQLQSIAKVRGRHQVIDKLVEMTTVPSAYTLATAYWARQSRRWTNKAGKIARFWRAVPAFTACKISPPAYSCRRKQICAFRHGTLRGFLGRPSIH